MNTSELIKSIRMQAGVSQREFARQLGIAFSTVNRWENGLFEPTIMARKLLKMYCIDLGIDQKLIDSIAVPEGGNVNGK